MIRTTVRLFNRMLWSNKIHAVSGKFWGNEIELITFIIDKYD